MKTTKKILATLKKPAMIIIFLNNRKIIHIPDKEYIKIRYKLAFNEELNLENPQRFDAKLQWLKLYDRKPIYRSMVDKYEAKKYVGSIIGKEYIVPLIGVYDKFDEIDFNTLPSSFVLKTTHYGGNEGVYIVKDIKDFNIKKCRKNINKIMKKSLYTSNREWAYKDIKPRIIIEKYLEDNKTGELIDYKVYAFNGKCEYALVCFDRQKGKTKYIFYDKNWHIKKEFSNDGMKYGDNIRLAKPKNLEKMFKFASILSQNMPFVRVDFYEANNELFFSELTLYPNGGFDTNRRKEANEYLSKQLILPISDETNEIT